MLAAYDKKLNSKEFNLFSKSRSIKPAAFFMGAGKALSVLKIKEQAMQVISAYILVVVVWSTTPLAIHFSNDSFTFVTAITLRMLFAFVCCYALLKFMKEPLIKHRRDWLSYAASALGLFPAMLLVYWAAQYIPSGLMSVVMGVYPFFVGVVSYFVLKENTFTISRCIALACAVTGLAVINIDQMSLGKEAVWGVLTMIFVCVLWAFSSVYVKKLGSDISPVRQGTGSVAVALPFFLVAWLFMDAEVPQSVSQKSVWAVTYLVIVGSVISHTLWFYVLREFSVSSVALIPLMTPVMAITWGILFAEESLSSNTVLGAGIILFSLALYQGVFSQAWRLAKLCRQKYKGGILLRKTYSEVSPPSSTSLGGQWND